MRNSALTGEPEMLAEEIDLLLSLLSSPVKGRILEVGTAAGGTMVRILEALPPEEQKRVVVVDTFDYYPNHLDIFRSNLAARGFAVDDLDVRVARSNIALERSIKKRETFSLIIVDGSHKLKHVTQDLGWLGLLAVGGTAAFHDYSAALPGVVLAVDKFLRKNVNYRVKARAGSLIVIEKVSESKGAELTPLDHLYAHAYSIVLQNQKSLRKLSGFFRRP